MDEEGLPTVVDLPEVFSNSPQNNMTSLLHELPPSELITDVLPESEINADLVDERESTVVVNGFWGARKPLITKIQEVLDSKLAAIKFYEASSKVKDRVEPTGLRFYPPLSNKDYFLDSRGRIPKLHSIRITSAGGTVYCLFKMAYFDEKRNSYEEKPLFEGLIHDEMFEHIDQIGPYLAGNAWTGNCIRSEQEGEQEEKEEIRDRVRKDETIWGVSQGKKIREADFLIQEACAHGRMLKGLSDKGKTITPWDQYFIDLQNLPQVPQKHEEDDVDGDWPGDELHKLYVPTRPYTLEEVMIRKIDLTMALDIPLALKVTDGVFNKFDECMKVKKELEYKFQDGILHCRVCDKYHIEPGGPMSIASRDTCGAFLPLWFPVNDYNRPPQITPWESFRKLFYEVIRISHYLENTDNEGAEVRLKQLYEWIAKYTR